MKIQSLNQFSSGQFSSSSTKISASNTYVRPDITMCVVHLADIKFVDLGRKTDWRIVSLVNKLIHC